MTHRRKACLSGVIVSILIILMSATSSFAADFTLAWDPNCNDYPNLIGYNIYFKADSSVVADQNDAELVYIALTDTGFDPEQPSYTIKGLLDNVRYYFTITAMFNDDETAMSNEVSAVSGGGSSNSGIGSITADSGSGSSGGCFIGTLN